VVKDTGKGIEKVGSETKKGVEDVGKGTKKVVGGVGHGLKKLDPFKKKTPAPTTTTGQ
jgi:hypothetical protein